MLLAASAACSPDITVPPAMQMQPFYARLELNHHAILLSSVSPYDTVTLLTTPMTLNGDVWFPVGVSDAERDAILNATPPVFVSADSSRVKVSPTGLVSVVRPTDAGTVRIIASRQIGNVTRSDTALVRVIANATPPVIKTFTLRPDSAAIANGEMLTLVLTAADPDGTPIPNVVTYLRSLNPSLVGIGGTAGTGHNVLFVKALANTGSVKIRTNAYVYGKVVSDSFTVHVKHPVNSDVTIQVIRGEGGRMQWGLPKRELNMSRGGSVRWQYQGDSLLLADSISQRPVSIVFERPDDALPAIPTGQNSGGGNIVNMIDTTGRYRRFLAVGRHKFTIQPVGIEGFVVVHE